MYINDFEQMKNKKETLINLVCLALGEEDRCTRYSYINAIRKQTQSIFKDEIEMFNELENWRKLEQYRKSKDLDVLLYQDKLGI